MPDNHCSIGSQRARHQNAGFQVLDSAKTSLEAGRADQVIAELAPILLEEAGSASHGPLSSRQSILEGLQLLQVKFCLLYLYPPQDGRTK